jgi:predicted nucleic acid-binding protein
MADGVNRVARQSFIDTVLATIPVEEYTVDVARAHARLLAHVRRAGQPRGAHDLIIAATALHRSHRGHPRQAGPLRRPSRRSGTSVVTGPGRQL